MFCAMVKIGMYIYIYMFNSYSVWVIPPLMGINWYLLMLTDPVYPFIGNHAIGIDP